MISGHLVLSPNITQENKDNFVILPLLKGSDLLLLSEP